ncbi:MAG: efflux RND transporter periplasmic adaptor subunit [Fimbriimonadaceae bacterium]|nr:efflux RND transporter periplasmic adaptor subunit [Fimbriimonadaceae bacterium]
MKKTGLIIGILLVVLCGGGLFAMRSMMSSRKAEGPKTATVEKGNISVQVVETGTVDAVKAVEIKSRVAGRVQDLFVEEGSEVKVGDKIAVIDPQETALRVEQDEAQLRGARSAVERTDIEISQRRVTAKAAYERAKMRVAQLEKELGIQPELTRTSIEAANTAYNTAVQARDQLVSTTQPNDRTASVSSVDEARANEDNAERDLVRKQGLLEKGYISAREVETSQLQLSLAKTRRQSAEDRLARLDAQQDLERKQADERVRQAKAELDRANANRIQDFTKRKEYEQAVSSLDDARAGLREVEVLAKSRAQSQASVDQLQSVLRDSRRQLGETDIVSPINGVVTKKLVQVGELVASLSSFSSGTPIVRVEDRTSMLIKLDINEIDVAKLKLGMDAEVSVDALPGQKFMGKIAKIAPASKATGTTVTTGEPVVKYEVEVRLDKADPRLKSGMSAKCTMTSQKATNVLKIPLEYLGRDGEKYYVALSDEGADVKPGAPVAESKPNRKTVTIGLQDSNSVEIKSGVEAGTKIFKPKFTGPKRKGAQFGREGD